MDFSFFGPGPVLYFQDVFGPGPGRTSYGLQSNVPNQTIQKLSVWKVMKRQIWIQGKMGITSFIECFGSRISKYYSTSYSRKTHWSFFIRIRLKSRIQLWHLFGQDKNPHRPYDLDINRVKVDCLSSSNELLRNTTLLLLINVAENNPILQKIIVFENCFEILLNVALSEGGIDNSPGIEKLYWKMRGCYVIYTVGEIQIGSRVRYYSGKLRISRLWNSRRRKNIIAYFEMKFDKDSLGTDSKYFLKYLIMGLVSVIYLLFKVVYFSLRRLFITIINIVGE